MLGNKIEFLKYFILSVCLVAAVTDLLYGKIYNWITLPTALIGLFASYYYWGWLGVGQGLLGMSVGVLFYGGLFAIRVMGGGDVKLLMALGACAGPLYVAQVALLGIILGGLMALALLLFTGRLAGFLGRMQRFLMTLLVKELQLEIPKLNHAHKMPFGIPLSIAAVWVIFSDPLLRLGVLNTGWWQ